MPPNPILLSFPDQFETARLLIRAPRPGDGPAANEAIIETLERLRLWMTWVETTPTIEDTEANVRQAAIRFRSRERLRLHLFRASDGLFVGSSGLSRVDWNVPQFEIGYWVRASLQGQGYITEAVNGITAFAFETLGAKRVEIRCDARNTRSAAVAERCGYTLEARLRNHKRDTSGNLFDTLVYARIAGG